MSNGLLAFECKVDQHDFIMAASYSDSWVMIKDESGRVIGGLDSWYICQAKTGPRDYGKNTCTPCYRIMASKDWGKRHSDPLATKQHWHCSCRKVFQAEWGQIVQMSKLNPQTMKVEKYYMKSDVPNWNLEDMRAMALEEELAPTSARELYDKVKSVKVALCDFIEKDAQGFHRIAGEKIFNSLPEFKWSQLYNFTK